MPVFFTFNLQTKFEMSSFIGSKDMAWVPKCRNESRDPDHAHRHHKTNTKSITLSRKPQSIGRRERENGDRPPYWLFKI